MPDRRPVPIGDIVLSGYFALCLALGLTLIALLGNGLAWANCAWANRDNPLPTRFVAFKGCYEQFDGRWVRVRGSL
ncbi:hypothetical protein [Pseudomonas sp. RL]|uniref:hypothetical protein n=1 Tax=Pseudomonas sp. RL TaxID=1452718 RepID=UPI0004869367|nr:hypothetical protein [Pseudomonas sp. RL]